MAETLAGGTVERPWESAPRHQLITWWEMEQFSAVAFFNAGCLIEQIRSVCLLKSQVLDPQEKIYNFSKPLDVDVSRQAIDAFERVKRNCEELGLTMSSGAVSDALRSLTHPNARVLNLQWLNDEATRIRNSISREMGVHGFFYISPDRGKYWPKWDQRSLFGDEVADAFPSALFDIHSGGVCLAIGLGTPCVFHLMRVVEIGLGVLGAQFGVSLQHTNWAPAIGEIESKIRDMHRDPAWKSRADCKEIQEQYAQAASHIGILKDAWRNYTMHSRGKYSDPEAEVLLLNVKGFMQKLAALGLKEQL